ncbi:hypothetical protein LRY60_04655 [Candidatus Woesebacteria bacterium]|nr:hypothetical protein [Candidatus Woesebacteria bacterium]
MQKKSIVSPRESALRRAPWILGACAFVFWVVMVGRVFWLQVWKSVEWSALAERNRTVRVVQRAPRGLITDRYGKTLAGNTVLYTQVVTSGSELTERILSEQEASVLMATAPTQVRKSYVRRYAYGPVFSHLVGYIQKPMYSSDIVFGRYGMEREYNATLAGTDGYVVYERNAQGQARRVLRREEPVVGSPLETTLDAELSEVAFRALGAQRGAVLVSNPKTGEVLAAVTSPSFLPLNSEQDDPVLSENWLPAVATGSVAPDISSALEMEHTPFLFRPTAAVYPPGSIFKIITALAGLEREVIDGDTTVLDEGVLTVGDFTYENWYWRQFGRVEGEVDVVKALARSNDIYFYKLAEWIGPKNLADFAHLFSLGERTGIGIVSESTGLIPDPAWKQQYFGERWFLGNTYHMGIGQGDVLVTPIQMQVLMSTIASRGRKCQPQVVRDAAQVCQELSLQPESLGLVIEGLRQACSAGGTAYPFF